MFLDLTRLEFWVVVVVVVAAVVGGWVVAAVAVGFVGSGRDEPVRRFLVFERKRDSVCVWETSYSCIAIFYSLTCPK